MHNVRYKKSNFPYNEQEGKIWLHDDECFFREIDVLHYIVYQLYKLNNRGAL